MRHRLLFACVLGVASVADAQRSQSETVALVDGIGARMIPADGPGCTVGVSGEGPPPVVRAFGKADLERDIQLTPQSILEAGSVSKQFTAAAVTLLAIDGKLSFDDDVRRWFPELPDYGAKVTVRHLLTHTSGLRDWGTMAGMEGWPRGMRAHSNLDALAIAARQKSLNYVPGSAYSYTNTGYNLLAVLVERASGKSLAQFSKERLFDPLGMRSTSWRDDYQRIVPGRALAYAGGRGAFTTDMPNEDAYGNGGLLTTAGDLLTWNAAMLDAKLGRAFADSVMTRMVLNNGRTISYALGLFVNPASRGGGTLEVQHSGATAGYRAHLIRFPKSRLSVAVLCNAGAAINATTIANQLADSMLKEPGRGVSRDFGTRGPQAAAASAYAGLWMHTARHTTVRLTAEAGVLRRANTVLRPLGGSEFGEPAAIIAFAGDQPGSFNRMKVMSFEGDTTDFVRVADWRPDASALGAFAGSYSTSEVRGEPFVFSVEAGQAVLRQGLRTRIALTPVYPDAFSAGGRMVWFARNASGRVTEMHFGEERAWNVVFNRVLE